MNQTLLSGIGNYLKCEILYDAHISPHTMTNSLTESQKESLALSITEIVKESLEHNGRILKYSDLLSYNEDKTLKEIKQFNFKVYQKEKDDIGNTVKCEETLDKRKTYWVPKIQT